MANRIEQLTQEQLDILPAIRDKWIKIGLSFEPLDFENAKKGALLAYEAAGLKAPEYFFVFDSPMSAAIGTTILKHLSDLDNMRTLVSGEEFDDIVSGVVNDIRSEIEADPAAWLQSTFGEVLRSAEFESLWSELSPQIAQEIRSAIANLPEPAVAAA